MVLDENEDIKKDLDLVVDKNEDIKRDLDSDDEFWNNNDD